MIRTQKSNCSQTCRNPKMELWTSSNPAKYLRLYVRSGLQPSAGFMVRFLGSWWPGLGPPDWFQLRPEPGHPEPLLTLPQSCNSYIEVDQIYRFLVSPCRWFCSALSLHTFIYSNHSTISIVAIVQVFTSCPPDYHNLKILTYINPFLSMSYIFAKYIFISFRSFPINVDQLPDPSALYWINSTMLWMFLEIAEKLIFSIWESRHWQNFNTRDVFQFRDKIGYYWPSCHYKSGERNNIVNTITIFLFIALHISSKSV